MNRIWIFFLFIALSCKNRGDHLSITNNSDSTKVKTAIKSKAPKQENMDTSFKQLLGPGYITFLEEAGGYRTMIDSADFDKDGIRETIVAGFDTANFKTKIVVYKKLNGKLEILDSSTAIESDGRGPRISLAKDTIVVTHTFHRSQNIFSFLFNKQVGKFRLVKAVSWNLEVNRPMRGHHCYFTEEFKPRENKLDLKVQLFLCDSDEVENTKHTTLRVKSNDRYLNELNDAMSFLDDVFEICEKYQENLLNIKCTHKHSDIKIGFRYF